MLIVCPTCATSYSVEPASLGAAGRSVRCASCRNVWFATPQDPEMAEAAPLQQVAAITAGDMAEAPPGPVIDERSTVEPPKDEISPEPAPEGDPGQSPEAGDVALAVDDPTTPVSVDEPQPAFVSDAPPLAPAGPDHGAKPTVTSEEAAGADIETFAARHARYNEKRKRRRWTTGLSIAIMLLIAVNGALIGWRTDIVHYLPQTASLYTTIGMPVNLRGIIFNDVRTTTETHEGVAVLAVEGTITSVSNRPVEVPRLRFAVRNEAGQEIYAWTALPSRTVLGPGEKLPFRSRLASPPAEARDVLVRFYSRRDLAGGGQ